MKVALAAYFLAVGLVLSAPLHRHFADGVPYTRHPAEGAALRENVFGDHLQLHFRLWLLGDTLFGPSSPFRNRYEFSTEPGRERPLASYFSPFSLVFLLFSPLGPGAGYNAALLASFVLGGLATHALVLRYTADRAAALVGGTAFAAAPYVAIAAFGGHPLGFAAFFLPLSVLLLERLLERPSLGAAAVAGAAFVLLADNDLQVLYFVALLCPLVVARHFAALTPRAWTGAARALAAPLLLAAGLAAAAVALKLSLLPPSDSFGGPSRSPRIIALYSPQLRDLLVRSGDSMATYVYPGLAICLAAAGGLALAAGTRRPPAPGQPLARHVLFYAALFGASLVLAFGPRFPVAAPYHFLYEHLPKFSLLRLTAKLMLPAAFALAVLAGLGWAAARRALPGRRRWRLVTGIVLAAIVADASPFPGPGVGISLLPARVDAYERVFRDRPESRVVNVPIWPGNDAWTSHYLYYATRYRTVMVNGYHPIVPPGYVEEVFRPLAPLNAGQLRRGQHELLRRMGVDYLVLHEESFPPIVSLFPAQHTLENLLRSPYLEPAALAPPVSVFRVRPAGEVPPGEARFASSVVGVALAAARTGEGATAPDAAAASGAALLVGAQPSTVRLQRNRTTPAGRFVLAASVKPDGAARFALLVRRAADDVILAERAFAESGPGYRAVETDFSLDEAGPIYYQLRGEGGALSVDWLYLRFADRPDPPEAFEFEELFHGGATTPDARASGGAALRLDAGPPAQVTRGPYRLFAPGRYVLTLSLALAEGAAPPPDTVVASVALRNHLDQVPGERDREANTVMAERPVAASALGGTGFREVAFPFTLERPAFLSLNLRRFGTTLLADRARVARAGS